MLSKFKNNTFFIGAFILTISGIATRLIGFFFRIFLSKSLGAASLGLYQLVLPIATFGFAVSGFGIQTAISRYVAANPSHQKGSSPVQRIILCQGCIISLFLSLPLMFLIYENAGFLSTFIFKEPALIHLIRIISIQIPISSLHCCISGYFIGRKNTAVPGFSQIIEQLSRVAITIVFWKHCITFNQTFSPALVIWGAILGEAFSVFFCFLMFFFERKSPIHQAKKDSSFYSPLLKLSVPVTLNRVFLTVLTSIEAILIPYTLKLYGLSNVKALSLYGIFSGMTFTFILFPSSIIQSVSTVLMPEVAELSSAKKEKNLEKTVSATLFFSVSMGIFFNGLFATYGGSLSAFLFHEPLCARYVKILSLLCPFMYLNMNIASILHGLERTILPFLINVSGTVVKISALLLFVPKYGMNGYFFGFLISTILESCFYFYFLKKEISFPFSFQEWIFYPAFDTLSCVALTYFCKRIILFFYPSFSSVILYLFLCAIESILFFLFTLYRNRDKIRTH